jgi:hypothetical protein
MYLEKRIQELLRSKGVIQNNESVLLEGDLYVAVNVVTNKRRIVVLDDNLLYESKNSKQLLKG